MGKKQQKKNKKRFRKSYFRLATDPNTYKSVYSPGWSSEFELLYRAIKKEASKNNYKIKIQGNYIIIKTIANFKPYEHKLHMDSIRPESLPYTQKMLNRKDWCCSEILIELTGIAINRNRHFTWYGIFSKWKLDCILIIQNGQEMESYAWKNRKKTEEREI